MYRVNKKILESKCEIIRKETGLNIGIDYAYDTQRIVLNGVYEKGHTGCKIISHTGTKKELYITLDAIYNTMLAMKYAGDEYRITKGGK